MNTTILNLKEKTVATIIGFSDNRMAGKFLAMGVLPGSSVKVVRIAARKGGYYLQVDGRNIAVRVQEAASILIKATD